MSLRGCVRLVQHIFKRIAATGIPAFDRQEAEIGSRSHISASSVQNKFHTAAKRSLHRAPHLNM
jgi:hypothetical protein